MMYEGVPLNPDFLTTILMKCGSIIKTDRVGLSTTIEDNKLTIRAITGRSSYLPFRVEAILDDEFSCNDALEELIKLEKRIRADAETEMMESLAGLIQYQAHTTLEFLLTEEGVRSFQELVQAALKMREIN